MAAGLVGERQARAASALAAAKERIKRAPGSLAGPPAQHAAAGGGGGGGSGSADTRDSPMPPAVDGNDQQRSNKRLRSASGAVVAAEPVLVAELRGRMASMELELAALRRPAAISGTDQ